LQQEALNLYEKLSVLRFVEENYGDSSVEIPSDVEDKLETSSTLVEQEIVVKEDILEETVEESVERSQGDSIETSAEDTVISESVEEEITPEEKSTIDNFQVRFEEFEAQLSNAKPNKEPSIFDDVVSVEEPVFVPVESTVIEQTEIKKVEITHTEATKNISINDAVRKNFNIGLNDKIAFEFHLFGGESEDFNRVLSQLNTFETFAEAKDFIINVVKPDYNNWVAKEEYENRFLEIIESKF